MIFTCIEHSDRALDDALEKTGEPPNMEKISDESNKSTSCSYCKNQAVYKIK
ncbi:CxxH/CxxC protein [Salibacterium salarium]|uniref:CxxH/CxxC protein n=1 Tax=Salibacterium salarium TaxID=284579 RepID=UPI00163AC91B|nr:CxxH/CxxC protein [Salibacterium salarium]